MHSLALWALCVVFLLPRATAMEAMFALPERQHTVWTGNVTASSPLQDKAQYKFFPPQCLNADHICCPNDCGDSLGRGECTPLSLDSSVCDLMAWNALGWVWAIENGIQFTCKCNEGWGGIDCMSCDYGWTGPNCDQRPTPIVRRDFRTLSDEEQDQVVLAFQKVREIPSPIDPTISWWNFLVQMHYWATSAPFNGNNVHYAHVGQGFPTWHRRYMREMELALQAALEDPTFALPYWNWTATAELIAKDGLAAGAADEPVLVKFGGTGVYSPTCYVVNSGVSYTGDCPVLSGPFADWPTYDPTESYTGVNWCPFGNLTRTFGLLPGNLPSTANVDYVLQQAKYSVDPFNSSYGGDVPQSFEAALEGNFPDPSQKMADTQSMHDSVHDWCGGSMSWLLTAANDPIFYMHHAFIDKLLETWIQAWGADAALEAMGSVIDGAPVGHARDECQGPFFPLTKHSYWLNTSDHFGYVYDSIPYVAVPATEPTTTETKDDNDDAGIDEVAAGTAVFYAAMGAILTTGILVPFGLYHRRVSKGRANDIPLDQKTHASSPASPPQPYSPTPQTNV